MATGSAIIVQETMWALNNYIRSSDSSHLPKLFMLASGHMVPNSLSCQSFVRVISVFLASNYTHLSEGEITEYVARELYDLHRISIDLAIQFSADRLISVFRECDSDHDDRLTWAEFNTQLCVNLSSSNADMCLHNTPTVIPWTAVCVERVFYIEPMRRVVITASTNSLLLYSCTTGIQVGEWKGHTSSILNVSYLFPIMSLCSCSCDRTLIIWDGKGIPGRTFKFEHPPSTMVVETRGNIMYVGDVDGTIYAVDLRQTNIDANAVPPVEIPCVLFMMHGHSDWINEMVLLDEIKLLISCSSDRSLRVWNGETGEYRYKKVGHNKGVLYMSFNTRYRTIVTGGHDKYALFWDPLSPSTNPIHRVDHDKQIVCVYSDPLGPTAITVDASGKIVVTDVRNYATRQILGDAFATFSSGTISSACFDVNHRSLVLFGRQIIKYKATRALRSIFEPIVSTHIAPEKLVMIVTCPTVVHTFSIVDGSAIDTNEGILSTHFKATSTVITPSNDMYIVATNDGRIRIFDLPHLKKLLATINFVHNNEAICSMHAVLKNSLLICVGARGSLLVTRWKRKKSERAALSLTLPCADAGVRFSCVTSDSVLVFPNTGATFYQCELSLSEKPKTITFSMEGLRAAEYMSAYKAVFILHSTQGVFVLNEFTMSLLIIVSHPANIIPSFLLASSGSSELICCDEQGTFYGLETTEVLEAFFAEHRESHWTRVHEKLPVYKVELRNRWGVSTSKPMAGVGVTSIFLEAVDLQAAANSLRDTGNIGGSSDVIIRISPDLEKYKREVTVGEIVRSPYVSAVLDHWISDDKATLYPSHGHIVFPAPMSTLWEVLYHRRKIDVLDVVRSILNGIMAFHVHGLVHMDIRPRNIALCYDGWKLVELEAVIKAGQSVVRKYSPQFCPPEMAWLKQNGQDLIAHSSYDMWCVGLIIVELCSGSKLLHDVEESNIIHKLTQIHQSWIDNRVNVELRSLTPQGLQPFLTLAMHTLKIDPSKRWNAEQCLTYVTGDKFPPETRRTGTVVVSSNLCLTPHVPINLAPLTIPPKRPCNNTPDITKITGCIFSQGFLVMIEHDANRGDYRTISLIQYPSGTITGTLPHLEAQMLNRPLWYWKQMLANAQPEISENDVGDLACEIKHTEVKDPFRDMSFFYSEVKLVGLTENPREKSFYMPTKSPLNSLALTVIQSEKATKKYLKQIQSETTGCDGDKSKGGSGMMLPLCVTMSESGIRLDSPSDGKSFLDSLRIPRKKLDPFLLTRRKRQ